MTCALLSILVNVVADNLFVLRLDRGCTAEAAEHLNHNRYEDDSTVDNTDHFAIETVKEANVTVDSWRLAELITESAMGALDAVSVDLAALRHGLVAWVSFDIERPRVVHVRVVLADDEGSRLGVALTCGRVDHLGSASDFVIVHLLAAALSRFLIARRQLI